VYIICTGYLNFSFYFAVLVNRSGVRLKVHVSHIL